MEHLRSRPLDIVSACRLRDLATLKLASDNLRKCVPFKKLHVFTAHRNFSEFAKALGKDAELIDEDSAIEGMTLEQLRAFLGPGLSKGAGWYLQQFLKFSFAFKKTEDDHYLIWDADTVPLRPLEFFDEQGRMLFTKATECHSPYFETYKKFFQQEPHYEFSFISQHAIVRKSLLREMFRTIEKNLPGDETWAWKMMRNLGGSGSNRFSEYETWGHYVKNAHPETAVYRELPWERHGNRLVSNPPSTKDLKSLGESYAFVAFEADRKGLKRFLKPILSRLPIPRLTRD
jgi:hypothetical protein